MRQFIATTILILVSFNSNAQIEKYQALFTYKFLQNFEWPTSKTSNGFKIGIIGNDGLYSELTTLVSGRNISGKSIEIVKYTPGSDVSDLCLIFLSNKNKDLFESINKLAISNATVVIGETPGLAKKGAGVNFITAGGSLKFELNESTLKSSNVKASGSIKSLAILVN